MFRTLAVSSTVAFANTADETDSLMQATQATAVSATGDVDAHGAGILDIDGTDVHVSLSADGEIESDQQDQGDSVTPCCDQNVDNYFSPPVTGSATSGLVSSSDYGCPFPAGKVFHEPGTHSKHDQTLLADCTNGVFYEWLGGLNDPYVAPTYTPNTFNQDANWRTTGTRFTAGWATTCVAYVETNKKGAQTKTCNEFCENLGSEWECHKGLDDAHHQTANLSADLHVAATCTLFPSSNLRTTIGNNNKVIDGTSNNGCDAAFKTQICGCAKKRPTVPSPPPTCQWSTAGGALPTVDLLTGISSGGALEDCTHKDYWVWKGVLGNGPRRRRGYVNPTFSPTVYGDDGKWTSATDMSNAVFPSSCTAYVATQQSGKITCDQFCTAAGMTCTGGMDDAHWQRSNIRQWMSDNGLEQTNCTLYPGGHGRKTTADNGCLQDWTTKICACEP